MPRKRRRSWGSITELTKGKKYLLRWTENTPDGRKRPCETFWGTYREASERLAELQVLRRRDQPTMTIGQAIERWYEPWLARRVEEGKTKPRTRDIYRAALEKRILPRWGRTPICSTPPLDIQAWLSGMTANDAKMALVVMRKAMDFPAKYELVESNKFRLPYEMPTRTASRKRREVYGFEKAAEVFGALRGQPAEVPAILALFGSARTGEALAVRPEEVGRAECRGIAFATVPVIRRVEHESGEVAPDGDLKTPESARTLVIPEPFGTRLLDIAARRAEEGCGWLSLGMDGCAMSQGSLRSFWERAMGADAIPFSNLRASWRTFAQFEWGVDEDALEVLMGHRLPGTTGRHYLRPSVGQLVGKMAEALDGNGAYWGTVSKALSQNKPTAHHFSR